MAHSSDMPQGPGFLIFFQNDIPGNPEPDITDYDRIMKDDNEILEIVTMMANCCGLLE